MHPLISSVFCRPDYSLCVAILCQSTLISYPKSKGENFHQTFEGKQTGERRVHIMKSDFIGLGLLVILIIEDIINKRKEKKYIIRNFR